MKWEARLAREITIDLPDANFSILAGLVLKPNELNTLIICINIISRQRPTGGKFFP